MFVDLQSKNSSITARGVVVDLSASGFGMETESDLPIGEEVECMVEVPLSFKAVVVRRYFVGQIARYGLKIVGQGFLDKLVMRKILKGPKETRKI